MNKISNTCGRIVEGRIMNKYQIPVEELLKGE